MKVSLEALGKIIKLSEDEEFTLESAVRDSIACDAVRACMSHPSRFGNKWVSLKSEKQQEIIAKINDVEDEFQFNKLSAWFIENFDLTQEQALNLLMHNNHYLLAMVQLV